MKKWLVKIFILVLFSFTTITTNSSCTRKTGCPVSEQVGPKVDKRGRMSTKRGKTKLFGKKHRKRMKR